jgi:hypothetical protein
MQHILEIYIKYKSKFFLEQDDDKTDFVLGNVSKLAKVV